MTKPGFVSVAAVAGAFLLGLVLGGMWAGTPASPEDNSAEEGGVTGIGGIFYKVENPAESRQWYRQNLGIVGEGPGVNFFWRQRDNPDLFGFTVWSLFPRDTEYFGPGGQQFMINYRVRDLDALLSRLTAQGVEQVGEIDEYSYGRFAWIVDGDGYRVELWEPTNTTPEDFE